MIEKKGKARHVISSVGRRVRRKYTGEEKMRIVLEGINRKNNITDLCRRENINASLYYTWRKQFVEAGKYRFVGDPQCQTWCYEVISLKEKNRQLKRLVSNLQLKNALLKKSLASRGRQHTRILKLSQIEKMEIIRLVEQSPFGVKKTLAELNIHPPTFYNWLRKYRNEGYDGLADRYPSKKPKSEDTNYQSAVFSVLHAPPSEFGINRTSWRMKDLKMCLAERGVTLSYPTIRKIIRSAGYRWKKARIVLTSCDPDYRQKVDRIQEILSSLEVNERFFSIDEFGPFAVKIQGGRKLVGPRESPSVPQFQKSKGSLIVTAALELSKNQVTHFYSKRKNSNEMIRMLKVLLEKYTGCERLFLSWDAAAWHTSKKLLEKIDQINRTDYRRKNKTPLVEVAPLPASAQFLNVIESIFSGMARAVIHNSDYGSVEEAMAAIDRYFEERNEYFLKHPKRAGKKIWGEELVASEFCESQNFKDPRFK